MPSSLAPAVSTQRSPRSTMRRRLSAWVPVLLAIAVIAIESTPFFGADHTSGPLRGLVEFFTGPLTNPHWATLHHIIRKCGHFTGYGLVSLTWFRAFWMTLRTQAPRNKRRLSSHSLAMAGTFLVASADEFHQTFLPNRTGTPWDVLIDCSGALLVQLVIYLIMLRYFRD